MMGNKEKRFYAEAVHLLLALKRTKDGEKSFCIRQVVKDYYLDLRILVSKLKIMGGTWRIYKTVNKRDCAKAMKWLMKKMIDHPEIASSIDSWWRTALLQRDCIYGEKRFLIDIDTEDTDKRAEVIKYINMPIIESQTTPNGHHIVVDKFDTRGLTELFPYVEILRDGYIFQERIYG